MEQENNFNVNFKELLNDKQELKKILNHIGQGEYQIDDISWDDLKDENRQSVILLVQNITRDELLVIIIDAINGEPNSNQVRNVTYNNMAAGDKRIILYSSMGFQENKNQRFEYEREMTEGFIKINNDCGNDTYLINVSKSSGESKEPIYYYETKIEPSNKKSTDIKKLPAKLEFEQALFRIYYDSSCEYLDHIRDYTKIEEWFEGCLHLRINDIDFKYPEWTEDGLFMHGVSKSNIGDVNLKWFKSGRIGLIKSFFNNREVDFKLHSANEDMISIKLWDKPFSFFTNSSVELKKNIVKAIRGYDGKIFEFWQEVFKRELSEAKIINLLGCIPADAFKDLEEDFAA